MIFKDEHHTSFMQKTFITIAFIIVVSFIGLLMFVDLTKIFPRLQMLRIKGDLIRQIILISCSIIYVSRLLTAIFIFWKRKLVWVEALTVSIFMPTILFVFSYIGGNKLNAINFIDILGIILYISGSFINTYSESSRYIWKKNPKNKGRLYTQGLFRYSMHINYFGEVVLFTGFALITNNMYMLLIPFSMMLNFSIYIIPSLDKHLKQRYGREFIEYAKHTKKFIPALY